MFLAGKTQKKHPGDLPPTVPDLPLNPMEGRVRIIYFKLYIM